MKRILFLQHYKCDDWRQVPYRDAVKRSKGISSPSIDIETIDQYFHENYQLQDFKTYDIIITSPIQRARQTAQYLKYILNIPVKINYNLREVTWDLSKHINEIDYENAKELGRYDIGNKRIIDFLYSNKVINIKDIDKRIKELIKDIQNSQYENIVCVTHGFFMKVIYIYFIMNKDLNTINEEDFNIRMPIKHLRGFEINI